MTKTLKKLTAVVLSVMVLFSCSMIAFAGGDGPFGFLGHTTVKGADNSYNNGEKFVLFYYSDDCSNSENVWSHIDSNWNTPYGYPTVNIQGLEDDSGIPEFMYNDIGGSTISLPVVAFIEYGKAEYYQGLTSEDVLDKKFAEFYDEIVPVESASISKTSLSLSVGQKEQLTVTVYPSNATQQGTNWTSSNYSVADINSSSGVVTAKAVGTATITARTKDGGIKLTCTVTVNDSVATTYTLTYDANGGSGAPSAQTGATSYTISYTEPSKSGYTFLGWSQSASASSASYFAGDKITLTSDMVLYAVWQKDETVVPVEITCDKCGKVFEDEAAYNAHIADCDEGNKTNSMNFIELVNSFINSTVGSINSILAFIVGVINSLINLL